MADNSKPPGTGAPSGGKPARAAAPRPSSSRNGLHIDSEQQARLMLIGAVVVILLVASGFIAFGYWYSVIRPRNRTVLQFDDTKISYSAMKRRMGYEFFQNVTYQQNPGVLPAISYQNLLDELTKTHLAPDDLAVGATDAEFEKELRSKISVSDAADQKTFNDQFRIALDTSGLNETEYRRLVLGELLDKKIRDKYTAEAPATTQEVKYEAFSATSADAASKAIARINGGEDFATVAKSVSPSDTTLASTGGLHDYEPQGAANAAYSDYLFSTNDIGKVSAPITGFGSSPSYYVVRLIDRSDQPVKDAQKKTIADKQINDWLKKEQDDLTTQGKIKRDWTTTAQNSALVSVVNDVLPRQQAAQKKKLADQQKGEQIRQTTVAELTARPKTAAAGGTPAADGTPNPDVTPAAGDTPVAGASPPADSGQSGSPAAPSQPVAPGNNGQ